MELYVVAQPQSELTAIVFPVPALGQSWRWTTVDTDLRQSFEAQTIDHRSDTRIPGRDSRFRKPDRDFGRRLRFCGVRSGAACCEQRSKKKNAAPEPGGGAAFVK